MKTFEMGSVMTMVAPVSPEQLDFELLPIEELPRDIFGLMAEARWGAQLARADRERSHEFLYRRLAIALRIASLIGEDDLAWGVFSRDPFFAKPPRRNDPILAATKYAMQAKHDEIQDVSRNSNAIKYFATIHGLGPDDLPAAIRKHGGGIAGAARLYSKARSVHKAVAGATRPKSLAARAVIAPAIRGSATDLCAGNCAGFVALSFLAAYAVRDTLDRAIASPHITNLIVRVVAQEGRVYLTDVD